MMPKEIDRSKPMRATHRKTGGVGTVRQLLGSKALEVGVGLDRWTAYFDRHGNPKDDFCPWRVENVPTVNWDRPIEAVRPNGDVASAYATGRPDMGRKDLIAIQFDNGPEVWCDRETGGCGEYGYIRNVQTCTESSRYAEKDGEGFMSARENGSTTYAEVVLQCSKEHADIISGKPPEKMSVDKALWERVVGLVRGMAQNTTGLAFDHLDEARAIAAMLPVEVDSDVLTIRKIAIELANGRHEKDAIDKGECDKSPQFEAALAVMQNHMRGRALERGE